MQVSYLNVQIHSKLKLFFFPQEVMSELPAPCSQCWRVQKHPLATRNNPFLPAFTASMCTLLELTLSGHRFCLHKICSPVSVTGALLPTLSKVHACSSWDHCCGSQDPKRSKAAMENRSLQVNSYSLGKAG